MNVLLSNCFSKAKLTKIFIFKNSRLNLVISWQKKKKIEANMSIS